jgi:hypothetical protein
MVCALTRDAPAVDCRDRDELVRELRHNADKTDGDRTWLVVCLVTVGVAVVAGALVVLRRRRGRRSGPPAAEA